jgi:hypothetical protein
MADQRTRARVAALVVVALLFTPVVTSAVTHDDIRSERTADDRNADELVVVAAQGDDLGNGRDSRLVVVNPDTERTVHQNTTYATYFDVDPLNNTTLLYAVKNGAGESFAVVQNWQTEAVHAKFRIANGTHDIDRLGDGRYAYVDGTSHQVIIIDRSNGTRERVWTYNFTDRFPPDVGGGDPTSYAGDYTHLNDVDAIDNASAFVVSPRNFDRVMLIDRSAKEIRWTLGKEDNYDVLYEQHNPNLISQDPPTVLVADSENNRIVEYRRTGTDWELTWEYDRDLVWPRDADRLPNGNTLLVDSRFVMEVTPSRETVWKMRISKFPYDAERIGLGDEPDGPPMTEFRDEFETAQMPDTAGGPVDALTSPVTDAYQLSRWIFPFWVSVYDFVSGGLGLVVLVVWAGFEINLFRRGSRFDLPDLGIRIGPRAGGLLAAGVALGGAVTLWTSVEPSLRFGSGFTVEWWRWDPLYHTLGILAIVESLRYACNRHLTPADSRRRRFVRIAYVGGLLALIGLGAGLLALTLGVGGTTVRIPNPAALRAAGAAALAFAVWRLLHAGDPALLRSPGRRSVGGLCLLLVALWALAVGASSAATPTGFLGIGLVLAVSGRAAVLRPNGARSRPPARRSTYAFLAAWYLLRVLLVAAVAATALRILGLGSIAGLALSPAVITPLLCTAVLLAILEWVLLRDPTTSQQV